MLDEKNTDRKTILLFTLIVIVILAVAVTVGVVLPAYFEAQAYERVTGKRVSTWDAIWLDLRVQEAPK
jgi:hypothetical protein